MNRAAANQSRLLDGSNSCDYARIQETVDPAIATGFVADARIDHVADIEKALTVSQRREIFELLGASVETMVVVKRSAWVTLSDLARRLRVSKQAAWKRVERLEKLGVLQTRSGPRGTKLVDLAQFDNAAGEITNSVRQLSGSLSNSSEGRAEVLWFVPETRAWACGGRSGRGLVAAIAALFSVDQPRAVALVCEALGRGLINTRAGTGLQDAPVERESTPAKPAEPRA